MSALDEMRATISARRKFYSNSMLFFARPTDFGYKSGLFRNSAIMSTRPQ
jgi:hypothetical protein